MRARGASPHFLNDLLIPVLFSIHVILPEEYLTKDVRNSRFLRRPA